MYSILLSFPKRIKVEKGFFEKEKEQKQDNCSKEFVFFFFFFGGRLTLFVGLFVCCTTKRLSALLLGLGLLGRHASRALLTDDRRHLLTLTLRSLVRAEALLAEAERALVELVTQKLHHALLVRSKA